MKTFALLLVAATTLWLAPVTGVAATVGFDNFALTIRDGQKQVTIQNALEEVPEKHVVHAVIRRNEDFYLVLGLSFWSRGGPQPRGTCGGGKEVSVSWLHVHGGKIVERQTGLYQSCFENREGEIVGWKDGVLLWQGWGVHHPSVDRTGDFVTTDYVWTFDSAKPEAGIIEHATDRPDSSPTPTNLSPSQP